MNRELLGPGAMREPGGQLVKRQAPESVVERPNAEPSENAVALERDPLALGERPRVLLVHPFAATFIERDLALLRTFCDVRSFLFDRNARYPALLRSILSADVVVCWFALPFAAVASLAARAVGRGSVLIAGGWEVTRIPETGYGLLLRPRRRILVRLSLTSADMVLAFSDSSMRSILEIAPLARVRKAYLGVDGGAFAPKEKQDLVVTVANVTQENVLRKGLRTFIEAAGQVPEARFILIGKHVDEAARELRAIAPGNVTLTGWIPDREVQDWLARARVYVQASYTEGFGVALAEAMSSACVPVVTRRGAIPEVVGEAGLYFEYGDAAGLTEAIRSGLRSGLGQEARRRILDLFNLDRRLLALRDAIVLVRGVERD